MRVFISFQYFLPAYKAGGPIQSINNLAKYLSCQGAEIFIFTSNKDLDGTILDVEQDKWLNHTDGIQVYYNSGTVTNKKDVVKLLSGVSPDVIFINGIFSPVYTLYMLANKFAARKILSVRGMLHPGALSQKALKKKVFLQAFKFFKLHNKCEYHSTTDLETSYVENVFGKGKKVWMVPNLPNVLAYQKPPEKKEGELKLVSVSLISPMKNILHVLNALRNTKTYITYDIYGPVKEASYWGKCETVIPLLPENVRVEYKGEVPPHEIEATLGNYHCFILPSKSENFGHAIYEALSAGKPVITSMNTPWNGLEEANAGYNVEGENEDAIRKKIENLAATGNDEYLAMSLAAKEYITKKYNLEEIQDQYKNMFSLTG